MGILIGPAAAKTETRGTPRWRRSFATSPARASAWPSPAKLIPTARALPPPWLRHAASRCAGFLRAVPRCRPAPRERGVVRPLRRAPPFEIFAAPVAAPAKHPAIVYEPVAARPADSFSAASIGASTAAPSSKDRVRGTAAFL